MDDQAIANGCPKCRPRHEAVVDPSGKLHPFCHFDLFILGHNYECSRSSVPSARRVAFRSQRSSETSSDPSPRRTSPEPFPKGRAGRTDRDHLVTNDRRLANRILALQLLGQAFHAGPRPPSGKGQAGAPATVTAPPWRNLRREKLARSEFSQGAFILFPIIFRCQFHNVVIATLCVNNYSIDVVYVKTLLVQDSPRVASGRLAVSSP